MADAVTAAGRFGVITRAALAAAILVTAVGCASTTPTAEEAARESKAWEAMRDRLTGDWTYDSESMIAPDEPWAQGMGEESGRRLGGWAVIEGRDTTSPQHPLNSLLTIGYDAHERSIVAQWVDSMQNMRWNYTGSLDETGDVLTLEADGPNPTEPGKLFRYRHVITVTGPDARTGASAIRMNGKWVDFQRFRYTRKK